MALGVLNNLSAIYAENNLNNTNSSLQTVLEQLSSGSKINSGADDAAGLSLVNGLEANQTALTQSETNATEGAGLLQVADGALSQVTSLLDRAITLATEASNGTLNSTQDSAANQEYQSILSEVNNIGQTTTYNQEQVFNGNVVAIYTGDSSMAGSSVDDLNIRTLSESSLGDTGGKMAYSDGQNNVFINLSSSATNAQSSDALSGGLSGSTTLEVNYLVKGAGGAGDTANTSITVGGSSGYQNTVSGLISAINNSGLGLSASLTTQAQAGVTGGGSETGIQISGGVVSAGMDPSTASTSGTLNPSGISASELLTQGQTVTVKVGGVTAAVVDIDASCNTLQEVANQIDAHAGGGTAGLVNATVVTNGDGTQSLSLASTAGNGALTVTTGTTGSGAIAPAFSTLTTATNASTVDLATPVNSVSGQATNTGKAGTLTLGVSTTNPNNVMDSGADTVSGKLVLTDGLMPAQTFIMGGAGPTTAPSSSITSTTVQGNTMSALALAIAAQLNANGDTGATAQAGTSGLVIQSGTLGNTIAATTDQLLNTNATLGLYTPADSGGGVYGTGLLAVTGPGGTSIAGTIGAADVLAGSVVITDGAGTPTTFTMGGTSEAYAGSTIAVNGSTIGALLTAINDYAAGTVAGEGGVPASFAITATQDTLGSGGIYLQSSVLGHVVTVSGNLSDTVPENHQTQVQGQNVVAGSAGSGTIGPASGSVNSGDTLGGGITITNSVGGNTVTHTFVLGGTGADAGLNGTTYTVNGSTLSDLAAAVGADTALGLTGLASTAGLSLTATGPTYSGVAPSATSTLSDTTAGTTSSVTLGSFASENDTVSGTVNFYVGTTPVNFTLGAGSTVSSLIQELNNPANNYGVNATWVPGTNGAGSVLITSSNAGTANQISSASGGSAIPASDITDTAATATLSYAANSPYNTGLSGSVGDLTSGQSVATMVADAAGSSGIATISYTDGAGEAVNATDLSNQTDAQTALNDLNVAITDVAAQDGYIGAQINTLNAISQVMSTQQENVVSAQNAVQATDYASATSNMSKYEILSQTGIAALAQANSVEQEVTKLLQ